MLSNVTRRLTRSAGFRSRQLSGKVDGVNKVAVIGLGLMGHGVAQMAAAAGYDVVGVETKQEALDVGMKRIEGSLAKVAQRAVKKGGDEAAANKVMAETLARIQPTTDLKDIYDVDIVVEAIVENMDVKLKFYDNLKDKVQPNAIFASNTSSLQCTKMAEISERGDKFVGLHFFNPVQMMKLVEVIRTDHTTDATFNTMLAFGQSIGKTTVSCVDTPGFIVNRLLVPYLAQAMAMVDRGEASIEDIDTSMQLGAGHPMGPIHLSDYIGLGTSRHVACLFADCRLLHFPTLSHASHTYINHSN
jgi:3-hydroxyacyl-CoA dehydrogenase